MQRPLDAPLPPAALALRCSPPGTVAAITPPLLYATCKNCSDGYYRPGFASFSNNVCKQIPAGAACAHARDSRLCAAQHTAVPQPGPWRSRPAGRRLVPTPCLLPPPRPCAGQREVSRASAAYPRAQVQACSKGEVSSWGAATRSPADPQECQPCLGDNTYAPRTGAHSCGVACGHCAWGRAWGHALGP